MVRVEAAVRKVMSVGAASQGGGSGLYRGG